MGVDGLIKPIGIVRIVTICVALWGWHAVLGNTTTGLKGKQKEMCQSLCSAGARKQSKKCHGSSRFEHKQPHHSVIWIVGGQIVRLTGQGHAIAVVVVGITKPIGKGHDFDQGRRYHGSSTMGVCQAECCRHPLGLHLWLLCWT